MKRYLGSLLSLCLVIGLSNSAVAGPYYKLPQLSVLQSVDKKTRTVVVRQGMYKLRVGVIIHDSTAKFPGLSSLREGDKIRFKTHQNRRMRRVEIGEIWILNM